MLNRNRRPLIVFFSGAAGGVCLSASITITLFYSRAMQTIQVNIIATLPATNTVQGFVSISSPTQTSLLDEAESALYAGRPEEVRELLYPIIETWSSNDDRIRGYKLLGDAELAQWHPQLAMP